MEYVKNSITGEDIFYHSSKKGIIGKISPDANDPTKFRDFGDGFYLGNKKNQTIALVNSSPNPKLYSIKIPKGVLNKENTLKLSKKDWMYFVLYNRKCLEELTGTDFYEYYAHLADNKQYIMGPIADDTFSFCVKDFMNGNITDYVFMQLIDRYSYGSQIVAKTQQACDNLISVDCKELSPSDRMNALKTRKLTRTQQEQDYMEQKNRLMKERKGLFISEIFEEVRQYTTMLPDENLSKSDNIEFESPIHEESEGYYEPFYL